MITTDQKESRVNLTVFGEFTLADFKEFEQVVNHQVRFEGPVNLLFDLRSMTGYSLDVAIEEWRYVRAHSSDFRKVALLTDDQFVTWGAWFSQFFTEADIRIFETERAARHWLDGDSLLEEDVLVH